MRAHRFASWSLIAAVLAAFMLATPDLVAKPRPEYDASAPAANAPKHPFLARPADRARIRAGSEVQVDDATGLPTFLWAAPDPDAAPGSGAAAAARAAESHEQAARRHLAKFASLYDLADDEVAGAVLSQVHDTGSGVVIVTFRQEIGGVPVLRDEIRLA